MARSPVRFVVLTSPRSGSSWLIDLLHSHPAVVAYGELFLGADDPLTYGGRDLRRFEGYAAAFPRPIRAAPAALRVAYLRRLYRRRSGVDAVGFKLMYGQASANRGLLSALAASRVRAVHLVRANLLSSVISYEIARGTGAFRARSWPVTGFGPVSLDPAGLRTRLEQMDWAVSRARASLERLRFPRLEIAYEELVGRRDDTLDCVLRFLGISPAEAELSSSLARSAIGSGLDLVQNADEVREALAGTRFEWMLEDRRAELPVKSGRA